MTDSLHFNFFSSYLGIVEFEVHGDDRPYRITLRNEAGVYERSIFNGTEADWQRDVVASVGLLYRHPCIDPIDQSVVDAFNCWRATTHVERVKKLRADPERYGYIAEDDPLVAPPSAVRGALYVIGKGWVVNETPPMKVITTQ